MFAWRRQRQKTEAALLLQLAAGAPHRIDGKSSPDTQGCSEGREPAVPLSPAGEPLLTFLFEPIFSICFINCAVAIRPSEVSN
jgi:hypothetical protein